MKKFKILIPCYNDWQSLFKLLNNIDNNITMFDAEFTVLIVNDCSTEKMPKPSFSFKKIKSIDLINIKKNQGHTRCNATGIKYLSKKKDFDYLILMDGDGEDRPEEIKNFIEHLDFGNDKTIVGERIKRSESFFFKICYQIHKIITLTFTGQSIKFGNYTCLPKSIVQKLINEKATWSSFSGALSKIDKNISSISSIRGTRYFGPSKMSFFNLIKHSLSIIAVFKTNVIIRSILFFLIYIFLISENLSYVTSIPLIGVLALAISVLAISKRENISELNDSLSNIKNIDEIK